MIEPLQSLKGCYIELNPPNCWSGGVPDIKQGRTILFEEPQLHLSCIFMIFTFGRRDSRVFQVGIGRPSAGSRAPLPKSLQKRVQVWALEVRVWGVGLRLLATQLPPASLDLGTGEPQSVVLVNLKGHGSYPRT